MMISPSKKTAILLIILIPLIILLSGCEPSNNSPPGNGLEGKLIIFHAGSLTVPVAKLSAAFKELHPLVDIQTEAAGSRTTARKVSELGREADLVMSADYQVINTLLIPEFASWNVLFARNSMVVTFTEKAAYADEINGENWYKVLLREDTRVGRSNPQADPSGYRTLMVWQLAEIFYQSPGLAGQLEDASPPENIRPKETDLIPLLQTGDLDYAFNYFSVAIQHDLEYIQLPDEINLSDPAFVDLYLQTEVQLVGNEPGQLITRRGEAIIYGVTIPASAPSPVLAEEFLIFLFSAEGRNILEEQGQLVLVPPLSSQAGILPAGIKDLVGALDD